MTMRKTMTAAALCTVALGSLIAQPAFASTLIDPSPKVSTQGNQVNAADIAITALTGTRGNAMEGTVSFPNGTVAGQIKYTAPEGTLITKVDTSDAVISPDKKTAILGKNTDTWTVSRKIGLTIDKNTVTGRALTGGKVEVIKDGNTTKSIDFSVTAVSALSAISTPSIVQGKTGTFSVPFSKTNYGQIKYTAPTGTRIKATDYTGCPISPDGKTALCGVNDDYWNMTRVITLETDGTTPAGTYTDGLVQMIHDGNVVDTREFSAKVTSNISVTSPVIDAGATANATLKFTTTTTGALRFVAPVGTTFVSIDDGACTVAPDGKTASCTYDSWTANRALAIKVPGTAVPGTVFTGGTAEVLNNTGNVTASTSFQVTASNKVAKPTVSVNHNVLSGTGIPGATINVRNDANEIIGTQVVPASGNWSIVIPFQGTGNKTMNVSQTYGTGTSDTELATINFGNGVQVTTPTNGSTVTTEKVTFTGTGTVGATIQVNGSTKNICTTEVTNDGTWSCESAIPLPNGPLVFGVKQISGTIESSTTVSFTKKYSASAAAVKFTEPAAGSTVYNVRPVFKGTGQPGAAIRVFGTSKTVASATVKEDGTWEAPATMDLGGDYTLNVEQTPTNGAATSRDTVSFKVRAGEASDVVVTTPAQDSTVTTKMVTYTGKGEPGAKIVINGTSKQIASATVKGDGTWEAPGTFELPNGKFTFKVTQTLANGDMKHTDLTFFVKAS